MNKKLIVISAINFVEGGPLTVLHNLLDAFNSINSNNFRIIVLINKKELLKDYHFDYIEFRNSKRSWFLRLYYEYIYFYFLSSRLNPYIWFSLHDISPFVKSSYKLVYCHNPAPFYNTNLKDFFLCPKFYLFSKFYLFLYKFNIKSNDYVIVQQEWLRNEFSNFFNKSNIVVSHPVSTTHKSFNISIEKFFNDKLILFYPAFPRSFKNFEVVCEAISLLEKKLQENIELRLTIHGNENRYSRFIYRKYKSLDSINFVGLKNKIQIIDEYNNASFIIFPSKLETWGLPISETKELSKPLLVSDLLYARETVGNYDMVNFLSPDEPQKWADCFKAICDGNFKFSGNTLETPAEPFAKDWYSLSLFVLNL